MGRKHHIILLMAAILVISVFSGCTTEDPGDKIVTESFSGEYNTNHTTTLKVRNSNGYVDIRTHEGDTVKLDVEKKVSEKDEGQLDQVDIQVTEENNEILIETTYFHQAEQQVTVNMNIHVPEYVNVELVRSSNGDISIRNVEGYPEISTSNGDVHVEGTDGISNVASSNGKITVEIYDFTQNITIDSSNANMDVRILSNLSATFNMQTSNGDITVIGLTLENMIDQGTSISGTLNGGGNTIGISTSNGDVELKKL